MNPPNIVCRIIGSETGTKPWTKTDTANVAASLSNCTAVKSLFVPREGAVS